MEKFLLVRKGAWTGEEDQLLRMYIDQYGEGKWHQIPERAGLNRCRKSCRLRWLNYLKPNIKRGEFSADEVDMIVRLHKLLGNRWSLIAGRLPGRTANDVKNHWNTHLRKKTATCRREQGLSETLITSTPKLVTKSNIIKPRPRTFSKHFFSCGVHIYGNPQASNPPTNHEYRTVTNNNTQKNLSAAETTSSQDNSGSRWWEDLLVLAKSDEECNTKSDSSRGGPSSQEMDACINVGGVFCEGIAPEDETNINEKGVPGPNNLWEHWIDFSLDVDLWSLLGTGEATTVVRYPI